MLEHPSLPSKPIILSRLPAKEWFGLDEAAAHSGWGRGYVRARIVNGELPAQACTTGDARHTGRNSTYRIHVDDLCFFIIRNPRRKLTEEPYRDVTMILRAWPAWMRREFVKLLNRLGHDNSARPDDEVSSETRI
jgi:hypothetical protein